jgi:hypothetical protein
LGLVDINLFNPIEAIHGYTDKVPDHEGVLTVGAHGNSTTIVDQNGTPIKANDLAVMIKNHPKYKRGMTIELLSCNTGKGSNFYAK